MGLERRSLPAAVALAAALAATACGAATGPAPSTAPVVAVPAPAESTTMSSTTAAVTTTTLPATTTSAPPPTTATATPSTTAAPASSAPTTPAPVKPTTAPVTTPPAPPTSTAAPAQPPPPAPATLAPFDGAANGQGAWTPAGRSVGGSPAVYETMLTPPGGGAPAGIAWMDPHLLSARLYSGSLSPGGGPFTLTAPIQPREADSLVAAFNGGFLMSAAHGGYYTEGRVVDALVAGAASLVITADGGVDVGAWGTDVSMTPDVVAVRQNLVPMVVAGQPTAAALSADWRQWGATCGPTGCSDGQGVEHQWRSAVGATADGALVFVAGGGLSPSQLAQLLVRAGVVRGMEMDINPNWPVLVTYDPPAGAPASPSNGSRLLSLATRPGPATFFRADWSRDFVTMSARPAPPS